MKETRTRTKPTDTETVVVRIPKKVYAVVKQLASAEYTTPRGYIERRLSEVAIMADRAKAQAEGVPADDADADAGPGSGTSVPGSGYL